MADAGADEQRDEDARGVFCSDERYSQWLQRMQEGETENVSAH